MAIRLPGDTPDENTLPQERAQATAPETPPDESEPTPPAVTSQEPQGPPKPDRLDALLAQEQQPQDPQPARGADRLDALLDMQAQQRDRALQASFNAATKVNPDLAAEAQRFATELGMPPDVAERNIDEVRAIVTRRQMEKARLATTSPILARQLSDVQFAKLAHDDFLNLSTLERVAGNWKAGRREVELGILANRERQGIATPEDLERMRAIERRLSELPEDDGFLTGSARILGQVSKTVPEALEAGAAAGTAATISTAVAGQLGPQALLPEEIVTLPAAFLGGFTFGAGASIWRQTYEIETGHQYQNMLRQGFSKEAASQASVVYGGISASLEVLGAGFATKPIRAALLKEVAQGLTEATVVPTFGKGATKAALDWAVSVGGETATELGQELAAIVTEEVAPAAGVGEAQQTPGQRLAEVAVKTLQGMALLGVPGPAFALHRDVRRAAAATQDQQVFDETMGLAEVSKVRARSPEAFEASAEQMLAGQALYFDGAQLAEVLRQNEVPADDLGKVLPDVAAQLPEAEATGGQVSVPASKYAAHVVGSDLHKMMAPLVKTSPDAMSFAEAEQYQKDLPKFVEDARKQMDAQQTEAEAFANSARDIEEKMRQQLVATKRLPEPEARAAATLYRTFYETLAQKLGVLPSAIPQITVQAGEVTASTPETLGSPSRGAFDPKRMAAVLFSDADISTVTHEFGHGFLSLYADIASQPNAPAAIVQDMQQFLSWAKVKDLETWRSMSLDQQRKSHEAFAVQFENYLLTGKAPSTELHSLFQKFRAWLTRIYRAVRDSIAVAYQQEFGEPLPFLNSEIRGVFDRMLASEDAIANAEAVRGAVPLFQTQAETGLDDAAFAALRAQHEAATDEAIAKLTQQSLRTIQWMRGARAKLLKKKQAEHDTVRREVRAVVAAELATTQIYRARQFLGKGEVVAPDGTVTQVPKGEPHKLNTELAKALLPEGIDIAALRGMVKADGLRPDDVALEFGYTSGEALVRDLLAQPQHSDAVDAATDARMMEEHSELADPRQVELAIAEAIHNEARARFVAAELNAATKSTQPVRLMLQAARQAAEQILANKPVRDISPYQFSLAEARASRAAAEAMKSGDIRAVIEAKRQQLVNHELARMAGDVRAEIDKALDLFAKFDQDDATLGKTRHIDYVGAGRAILAQHGIGDGPTEARPHLDGMREYNPELYADLAPTIERVLAEAEHYRDLTLDEFRLMRDTVNALWFQSKREREILVDGKRVAQDGIVNQLIGALGIQAAGDLRRTLTAGESRKSSFGGIRAGLRRVESWTVEQDGGTPGVVHRYLFALLREPYDAYQKEKNAIVEALDKRLAALDLQSGQAIEAQELNFTFRDKRQLLGALEHMGNESNLRNLLLGYDMVPQPTERGGQIDESPWWRFVNRKIEDGTITKQDLDHVQANWNTYESLLPREQEVHMDVYGFRAEEVPARPFTTKYGTYAGGYVPSKIDRAEAKRRGHVMQDPTGDAVLDTSRDYKQGTPSTGRGFMIARTRAVLPRLMDVRLQAHNLDEHLRFIHMQRPGRDVLRLLRDKRLAPVINQLDPAALGQMLMPWLSDTLQNRVMAPGGNPTLTSFLVALRRNAGMGLMFGNLANALQQATGLGQSALYVRLPFLRAAASRLMRERGDYAANVVARSEFMELRLRAQLGQIIDDRDVLMKPGWLGDAQKWTQRHAYFLQRLVQNPVDLITWGGAYDQATADGKSEAEAVRAADSAVRLSQGSGTAPDISKFERGSAVTRLLMQFSGFWITSLNTVLQRHGTERGMAIASTLLVTGLLGGAISQALRGGWDDEDDDSALWDDVTSWAFGEVVKTGAATALPSIGPAALRALTGESQGRLTLGAGLTVAGRALGAIPNLLDVAIDEDRDLRGSDVRDVATLLNLTLGLPTTLAARPLSFGVDVLAGKAEPTGVVDAARGYITGRASVNIR